jgi:F-type H+-transporting ATPase subunit delta
MGVASRYAKSLLDLSVQTKQLEEVRNDMLLIGNASRENRDLVLMLESPVVKTDRKMKIFKKIFEGKISATTLAFLNLIATKRREGLIDDIALAFEHQYKVFKKITTAVVTTAVPLDNSTKSKILDIVKEKADGEVLLIEKIDKSLIGGFVLTVNDKQIDASIKRKLNDLKKDFSVNLYVPELN